MKSTFRFLSRMALRLLPWGVASALGMAGLNAAADPATLRTRHAQLHEQLKNNVYQRALYIDSAEQGNNLKGDVYAVLDYPFATVSEALRQPEDWCDIMILPFNTKYCHAVKGSGGPVLLMRIGRKFDQPVQDAYRIEFSWRNAAATPDYLETALNAPEGPLGTRDYRINVSVVPLEGNKSFMHLSYSYGYGVAGRLAMQAYMATVGADKVGFSVTGRDANGQPVYIGGVRGAIERNAMRYYLAIGAHLAAQAFSAPQQADKRIQAWFNATERYPRQLREMDRSTYVAMKRTEVERQQALLQ